MKNKSLTTTKVVALIAVASATLFLNTNSIFSATETNAYTTVITYVDCNTGTQSQAINETWIDNNTGRVVYTENSDCWGDVATTGQRPLRSGKGKDLWNLATEDSKLFDIPISRALSFYYKPVSDSIEVNANGKIIGEFYEFEFPLEWLYNLILIYPNPTNSTTFIKFNPEMVSKIDDGRIIMNLYYNDKFIHRFATDKFDETITINSDYLVEKGVYHLNCNTNITYKDGKHINETFTVSFVVVK